MATSAAPETIPAVLPEPNASRPELHAHLANLIHSLRAYKNATERNVYQAAIETTTQLLVAASISDSIEIAEARSGKWAKLVAIETAILALATVGLVWATWRLAGVG